MGWATTGLGLIGTAVGGYFGGPAGAAAVGAIGGGIGSAIDGDATNARNAEQAQMARDWQLDAMRSAHQREVHDLKEAGLNPIISAHNSPPIPNPATSTAIDNSSNQITAINNATQGYQAAKKQEMEFKVTNENILNTQAQTAKTQSDTVLSAQQAAKAKMETILLAQDIPQSKLKAQVFEEINRNTQKLDTGAKKGFDRMSPEIKDKYFKNDPYYQKPVPMPRKK